MKKIRNLFIGIISSFLAASSLQPVQAKTVAEQNTPVHFETEAAGLPDYTEGYEMQGVSDPDAEVIDSMFSDEDWAKFNQDMDRLLEFEPVEDNEVAALFTKVAAFRTGGGVASYIGSEDLSVGAAVGLTANHTDKVEILGQDGNASDWIYVVDKDATCFVIRDEDGNDIVNAQVTISYVDEDGNRKTSSIITTDGNKPGIAVFAGLPETFNGILDIEAENFRAISMLDKTMEAGDTYTFILKKAEANELYIRGADLDGKDLFFEETDISLVDMDTEDMALKVIVSRNGSEEFPDSIDLYSETRKQTVLTMDQSSGYEYDENTRVYTTVRRWVEQEAGLFADGDVISVRFKEETVRLEHFTIENAREIPHVGETQMPVTSTPMDASITDRMGGAGWLNFTCQVLQVPVTFGVFPDGTFIFMASYDITSLDQNTQYKFSSLFEKSWKPKQFSNIGNVLETFQKSFWQNAQKVNSRKTALNSKDKVWLLTNKSYNIGMSFSVFFKLNYNKTTDDYYGTGGFVFNLNFSGGITEYFVFFAGPVAIPLYIGFELGVGVKIGISVNLFTETPPDGEAYDKKWKYTSNDGRDLNSRIEAIGNLDVFGGVGIKGVLGANATGYFTVDIAAVLGKGPANIFTADPHTFVDLFYGLIINYYFLFFSGQIKLDCLQGAKRIYDSWGEHDLTMEDLQLVFRELSLESCADELIPLNDSSDTDPAYTIANNDVLLSGENLKNVDAYTYPDNQAQFVSTKDYTALFRIVSDGEKTHLVYQYQDPVTGDLLPAVYQVQMPDDKAVTEYVAVANKAQVVDERYSNYAYIGAVIADNTVADMNARAKTSEVAAIVIDLAQAKTIGSEIASDPKDSGKYTYSAPHPSGIYNICDVCYAATLIEECENSEELLKTIADGISNPDNTITNNIISYREINDQSQRQYRNIGSGTVFSTGSASPLEPTYWIIDQLRSSNQFLVVKGYEADGKISEDQMHYFRIDISDMNIQDFNYEPILTNWMYLNGRNYFIAGDTVYWMYKDRDALNYEWIAQPVENGEGMVNTDGRYTMFTNNNQSAVYIAAVIDSYDINIEDWTETKSSNHLRLHTLITDDSDGTLKCKLHGPLEFGFARGDRLTNFTAAYNPENCESRGLSIVYSSPIDANRSVYSPLQAAEKITDEAKAMTDESEDDDDWEPEYEEADEASTLRLWKQNAERGMRVTEVKIPQYVVRNDEPYIVTNVTYRNYGYAKEGPIMFRATDEAGNILTVSDGTYDYGEYDYFYPEDLYTGDSASLMIYIRPYSGWEPNSEHEITIEVLPAYRYDGDLDDVVNTALMEADDLTLTAENILIGDEHYVSLAIANNTFVGEKTPMIKATFRYDDSKKEETKYFLLPTNQDLLRYDGNDEIPVDQIYNIDLNMDQIWKDGAKEGLEGIYFSLVDENDLQQSNEIVYVLNPEENVKDLIVGVKLDENGEPLAGASIALYAEGSEEPLENTVSDENGQFLFSNLTAGSYIVKETAAPEGYVLDETGYPVTAQGNGDTFEIELTNRLIRGSLKVNLSDSDGKKLSGALFALFDGDTLIGKLTDCKDGTYLISNLPYGEYTLKTEKAPNGYKVSKTYTVKISEDGVTVEISVTAEKLNEDSADTSDHSNNVLYGSLLVFSLAIAMLIILRRKKDA